MRKTASQKYLAKKKRIANKAKALWQELVVKSKPICEGQGIGCTGKSTCGHHFIYKSVSNHLRFDLRNGIGLCQKCHYALHNTGRQGIVYLHIIGGRTKEWKAYIDKNSGVIVSTTLAWHEEKLEALKAQLNPLKNTIKGK
jgi:hypothetical protein|tara:strand:+ start:212 stop:634 length:423 start_codon:yes stop_codon:yes gene_type:complete